MLRNEIHKHMYAEKTAEMSFSVTPRTKRLPTAQAKLPNMLEVLVEEFCVRNKINETPLPLNNRGSKVGRTKK